MVSTDPERQADLKESGGSDRFSLDQDGDGEVSFTGPNTEGVQTVDRPGGSTTDDSDGGSSRSNDDNSSTVVFEDEATNEQGQAVPGDVKGVVRDDDLEQRVQDFAASEVRREQQRSLRKDINNISKVQDQSGQRANISTPRGVGRVQDEDAIGAADQRAVDITQPRRTMTVQPNISLQPDVSTTQTSSGVANIQGNEFTGSLGRIERATRQQRREEIGPVEKGVRATGKVLGGLGEGAAELIANPAVETFQQAREPFTEGLGAATEIDKDIGLEPAQPDDPFIEQIIRPETESLVSDREVQGAAATTAAPVVVTGVGTAAGAGAATTTGGVIEAVDLAGPITTTATGALQRDADKFAVGLGTLVPDLLPGPQLEFTPGKKSPQTQLGSNFEKGTFKQANVKVETVEDTPTADDFVAPDIEGQQSTLESEFGTSKPIEDLPQELRVEDQQGNFLEVDQTPQRDPSKDDIDVTENDLLTGVDNIDKVPGSQPIPDDQSTLRQFEGTSRSRQDNIGVAKGTTGETIITPEGSVTVQETPTRSLDSVLDDKKGEFGFGQSAKLQDPLTDTTKDSDTGVTKDVDQDLIPGKPSDAFVTEDITVDQTLSNFQEVEPAPAEAVAPKPVQSASSLPPVNEPLEDVAQSIDSQSINAVDTAQSQTTSQTQQQAQAQSQQQSQTTQQTTATTQNTTQTTQNTTNTTNTTKTTNTTQTTKGFDIDLEGQDGDEFTALVKRGKGFEPIGTFNNPSQAFDKAIGQVENTADMTFKVVDKGGDVVDADPASDFRQSKSNDGFVELRNNAINTPGEFQDITRQADQPSRGPRPLQDVQNEPRPAFNIFEDPPRSSSSNKDKPRPPSQSSQGVPGLQDQAPPDTGFDFEFDVEEELGL